MDLPTYTNIWRIEKRLYKLYDFRLPQPVSVVFLGVLLGTYAVWFALLAVIGVPFTTDPPWHVLWLVPPFIITFFATRPVMEGKRLSELVVSQVRYMAEARVYTSLSPEREPTEVRVAVRVWHRDPAAGPLPAVHKKTTPQNDTVRAARGAPVAAQTERPVEVDRARTGAGAATANDATPEAEPLPTVSSAGAAASARPPRAAPPLALDARRKERREHRHGERFPAAEPMAPAEPMKPVESAERVEPVERGTTAHPPTAARPAGRAPRPSAWSGVRPQQAAAGESEHAEETPAAAEPVRSTEEPVHRPAAKRGVGLKLLNYFGFALPKQDRPDDHPRPARPDRAGRPATDRPTNAGPALAGSRSGPIPGLELSDQDDDGQTDHDAEWISDLGTSSGQTPWPLSSKAAYERGDTGPMPPPDTADTRERGKDTGDVAARRRAEEMMSAPEPAPSDPPEAEESAGEAPAEQAETGIAEPAASAEPTTAAPEPVSSPDLRTRPGLAPHHRLRARSQAVEATRRLERRRATLLEPTQPNQAESITPAEAVQPPPSVPPPHPPNPPSEAVTGDRTPPTAEAAEAAPAAPSPEAAPDARDDLRERERPAPQPPVERAHGLGEPAPPEENHEEPVDKGPRRRPHAAPWDLPLSSHFYEPRGSKAQPEEPDDPQPAVTDDAEDTDASSSAGDTTRSADQDPAAAGSSTGKPSLELDHGTGEHRDMSGVLRVFSTPSSADGPESDTATHSASSAAASASEEHGSTTVEFEESAPAVEGEFEYAPVVVDTPDISEAPTTAHDEPDASAARPAPETHATPHPEGDGKDAPPPEGRLAADTTEPAERPRNAAEAERLEVLDRHLNRTDTPPPPPPRFADADGPKPRPHVDWFTDDPAATAAPASTGPADAKQRRAPTPTTSTPSTETPADQPRPTPGSDTTSDQRSAPATATTDSVETTHSATPEPATPATPTGPADPGESAEQHGATNKPPLELDHGTGEHESFSEIDVAPRRATPADLEAAEAAALRSRQRQSPRDHTPSPPPTTSGADASADSAADSTPPRAPRQSAASSPEPSSDSADTTPPSEKKPSGAADSDTGRSDRLSRSMRSNPTGGTPAISARPHTTDSSATPPTSRSTPRPVGPIPRTPTTPGKRREGHGPRDAHHVDDGVFNRVAQNARRISDLFGTTPPGQPPEHPGDATNRDAGADSRTPAAEGPDKPTLQLDHGTGEQASLTDPPHRTPARHDDAAGHTEDTPTPGGTRGWRRLARVVSGGSTAPQRSDLSEEDVERLRTPLRGTRRVVVLGCTGGAGQTVTTLMLGHTLAAHRDERVVAVDVNPGLNALSRRVRTETPETLTSLLANADSVHGYLGMRKYTSQAKSGLEVVSTLDDPYVQTLDDRDYAGLTSLLANYYGFTLLDPAATGVARALPIADGLVLVAPASADAARAVDMTFEWLDGHGYANLRMRAVVVVNGVSKRSLGDVDDAERVARGRCRAIVRVPWDDHLAAGKIVDVTALRSTTRRAHAALGGVLVHGLSGGAGSGRAPAGPGHGPGTGTHAPSGARR
ncbi:hypothetical protein GCM10009799_44570 [Nocardiopsis rhodophaea]|uniref:MinD-like ATPase involved in chromosome partitioning or flagellar assembly n=1 Tax=Nocardiopsis rhodophaea TaxID=280238 RepID=A0ABP5EYS2_9ACTN